jgi:uncharacterized protein YndB with AHSA1/START domain
MPAAPRGTSTVEHDVRVAAPPETVFAYFTDPMRFVQWMGAEAMLDPRPGGVCRIVFRPPAALGAFLDRTFGVGEPLAPDSEPVVSGQFVEVVPPRRIVFTWGWERDLYAMPPQSTEVEVSLEPDGDGTVVRLTHRSVPTGAVELHRGGWQHYLPRLATVAAGGDAGADPWEATSADVPR